MGAGADSVHADYFDDVGYAALQAEIGPLPDGTGLTVALVEACTDTPTPCDLWRPDPGTSRVVTAGDGGLPVGPPYSGHATGSGNKFYGNNSTTPGIGIPPSPSIAAYEANDWAHQGFLRSGEGQRDPNVTPGRIANHSWVGSTGNSDDDLEVLHRFDWVIDTDEYVQAVGFVGNSATLLGSAFNAIAVNRTNGPTNKGSQPVPGDPAYNVERTRPDLVAPEWNASGATPRVASAAALLMHVARADPTLSNGSTTNRAGATIRNAERSEVVKAALMAGADRATSNTFPAGALGDITDYRLNTADRTANGLDRRFGAGQLSIYSSYHVIAAGEQDSLEDGGAGAIADSGFDYDPAFGGSSGSNGVATYFYSTGDAGVELFGTLAWNIEIDAGGNPRFQRDATLRNLDLRLYDRSNPSNWVLVEQSTSTIDNTENIRARLAANTNYALRVTAAQGQGSFAWDYALAWRSHVPGDVDGDRSVGLADVLLMQRAIAGRIGLSQPQHSRADVHPPGGDGALTVSDLLALQRTVSSR